MSRKIPKLVEVEIDHFSRKGNGIGEILGSSKPVEVPFAIPGDKVRALVQRKRAGVSKSSLEEIIKPASTRITPRCIHFGICGGCRWQQLSYEDQLNVKQKEIERLFHPLMNSDSTLHPIIACDLPWQYRNKMEFSFSEDSAGRKFLGLVMDGSRGKVFNLTECHLVNSWFVDALKTVYEWWKETSLQAYHPHRNTGSLRTLTVREGVRTGDRMVILTVSGNPDFALSRQHLDSFTAFVRDAVEPIMPDSKLSIFLRIHQAIKGSQTTFFEMLLYGPGHIRELLHVDAKGQDRVLLTFEISPSAFFQPNTKQAEKLYNNALKLLDISNGSIVYDFYCGTGTLGLCAAKQAKQVVGIEISPEACLDARSNVTRNGFNNIDIVTGSVPEVLKNIRERKSFPMPDIAMIDPPRVGIDKETIKHISEIRPSKLLYISCNPYTQVENIKDLQNRGYRLATIQPIDQFPHTVHIENIAILVNGG